MIGGDAFLPYARQQIDEADIAAVVAVLKSDWLTTGPAGPRFESALAARVGAAHATVCSSGTAALHLAYLAAGIGLGDAVIVPSVTFLATGNAARMVGAEPFFADVDPDCGLITPEAASDAAMRARRAGFRVKAIVPVHLAGQTVHMAPLAELAASAGAAVIEDACHALGTWQDDAHQVGACRYSSMTVFSFHAVKTVAAGEGGAITTNDVAVKAHLDQLRSHGMVRTGVPADQPWRYEMHEPGWNYRLSDLQGALAASQLGRLDDMIAQRQALVDRYDAHLRAGPARPIARTGSHRTAWHLYPVLIDFETLGVSRGSVMRQLADRGIGTQVHYIPVHRQPYYAKRVGSAALPGAEAYYDRTLSLPLHCAMSVADADRVASTLLSILEKARSAHASGKKIAA